MLKNQRDLWLRFHHHQFRCRRYHHPVLLLHHRMRKRMQVDRDTEIATDGRMLIAVGVEVAVDLLVEAEIGVVEIAPVEVAHEAVALYVAIVVAAWIVHMIAIASMDATTTAIVIACTAVDPTGIESETEKERENEREREADPLRTRNTVTAATTLAEKRAAIAEGVPSGRSPMGAIA